ncbi:MAG TPA: 1-deoxy-D-xylulose-5-phosphate reductoisomerase [Eubacteriaceae bacterium]|nr:1-deoxy-D-xylulose-5-phosphate reductoisomerase [Eubacteriaceae bacterium]
MKNLAILGSTGSIGTQTIDVAREHRENFNIIGLSTYRNIDLLEAQILEFNPKDVCVMLEDKANILKKRLVGSKTQIYTGIEGLIKIATLEGTDLLVNSLVGTIGIQPTIAAINKGIDIGLANKETLVSAGSLVMDLAKEKKVKILPIDSEHSAIFQCIRGNENNKIANILLTASGGPFRGKKKRDLINITPREAINHPNWSMGEKISVDSATLMNKGLELIEAKWLFDMDIDKIKILIHPQSIVHSAVEYEDGSIIAQLGEKDMKVPIAYALNYPNRKKNTFSKLDLVSIGTLTFYKPDIETFQCLRLAYEAIKMGGTMAAVLNGANEKAVELFIKKEIGFLDIPQIIQKVMDKHKNVLNPSLEEILYIDTWAKEIAVEIA